MVMFSERRVDIMSSNKRQCFRAGFPSIRCLQLFRYRLQVGPKSTG